MKKMACQTPRNSLATTHCCSSVMAAAACCAMTGCKPTAGMLISEITCNSVVNTPYSLLGNSRATIGCTRYINAPLETPAIIIQPLCRKKAACGLGSTVLMVSVLVADMSVGQYASHHVQGSDFKTFNSRFLPRSVRPAKSI